MTDAPRTLEVSLEALGSGPFEATLYTDTPGSAQRPNELAVAEKTLEGPSSLTLDMVSGGGAAVHLRPGR